ncbi:MAG TPA: hypothetical protein VGU43_04510 [Thermoplasmata archaeon]|nr:hypothetical protein [Thermoplasmata archaeon]
MPPAEAVPTRVDTGLRASIAHGPEKDWDRVGMNVTLSVTVPAAMVRWARAHGIVLSRVLRDSVERLQGGASLARTREELQTARERVLQLETYEARLLEEAKAADDAKAQEKAREKAIRELTAEFAAAEVSQGSFTVHRPSLGNSPSNLAWIEPRVEKNPVLRPMKARAVLDLVLTACSKSEAA